MIVLDTTVLVYAVGTEHPLREPCQQILRALARGDIDGVTTIEVIQEFAHVRARRRGRADAVKLARGYATALRLLSTTTDDLERGLSLYVAHERLGAFDAVLAAAALNQGAQALVSADRAFGVVRGLPWVDPAGPDLAQILP